MKKLLLALLALSTVTLVAPAEAGLKVCSGRGWNECEEVGGSSKVRFTVTNTGTRALPVRINGSKYYVQGCSSRKFTTKKGRKLSAGRKYTPRNGSSYDLYVKFGNNLGGPYSSIEKGEPNPRYKYSCQYRERGNNDPNHESNSFKVYR